MPPRLTQLYPKLLRESLESQRRAGRHNPAAVIRQTIDGAKRRHVLPIGDDDDCALFVRAGRVFCVSWNARLDYCGVQAYDADDQEPREELSIFAQGLEQVAELLGPRGLELSVRTIARRLIDRLEEVTA
jgi:hypothetical protein